MYVPVMHERDLVVRHFIHLVRQSDLIWNPNNSQHYQQDLVTAAWHSILESLQNKFSQHILALMNMINVKSLKKKWKGLRGNFVQSELRRMTNSLGITSVPENPKKWDAELTFLQKVVTLHPVKHGLKQHTATRLSDGPSILDFTEDGFTTPDDPTPLGDRPAPPNTDVPEGMSEYSEQEEVSPVKDPLTISKLETKAADNSICQSNTEKTIAKNKRDFQALYPRIATSKKREHDDSIQEAGSTKKIAVSSEQGKYDENIPKAGSVRTQKVVTGSCQTLEDNDEDYLTGKLIITQLKALDQSRKRATRIKIFQLLDNARTDMEFEERFHDVVPVSKVE